MTEEAKRLHEDMMDSLVLQGKLKVIMEHGTPEEQVKAISELGYSARRHLRRKSYGQMRKVRLFSGLYEQGDSQ